MISLTFLWQNKSVVHFNLRHPPTTIMHFDQARHQVALPVVLLVDRNRLRPVRFIRDTIQRVDSSSAVRARANLDKSIKLLQIHILNFNLNLIKIKQSNQIHSDPTGKW